MIAFLPCRLGSQRIPNKNVIPFAGEAQGLLSIKLRQLLSCEKINTIILSSNDDRVLDYGAKLKNDKIILDERPMHLGSSETSTDDLIKYVGQIIKAPHILWTHVTSPFITSDDYSACIEAYYKGLEDGYDSLMTAKKLQGFIWKNGESISYDRCVEKWPRTQTIDPMYELDSGVFINSLESYKETQDRIGAKPYIHVLDSIKSLDIDWPEDFDLAEQIWIARSNS